MKRIYILTIIVMLALSVTGGVDNRSQKPDDPDPLVLTEDEWSGINLAYEKMTRMDPDYQQAMNFINAYEAVKNRYFALRYKAYADRGLSTKTYDLVQGERRFRLKTDDK